MARHPLFSLGRLALAAGLATLALAGVRADAAPASSERTADARDYSYESLDYPGSSLTIFWGLDDFGRLAGEYAIAGGTAHAMTYRRGRFAPLDPDDLGTFFSAAGGPDDSGRTFGGYADATGLQHGFVSQHGRLKTVDFPGHLNSNIDGRAVTGWLLGVTWEADGIFHGIVRKGATDTPFDVDGARDTYPLGINASGDSVGFWDTDPALTHGYLRKADGGISTLDVPGALSTAAFGINDLGQVGGYYVDATGVIHGFVRTGGKFRVIDMPGAAGTIVTCLNNLGTVAGEYLDASGARHGFVATLK